MKNKLLLLLLLPNLFLAQDSIVQKKPEKINPIIYADFYLGPSKVIGGNRSFLLGGALNYQRKKDLFTIRYIENSDINIKWFIIIPIFEYKSKNQEIALLYGKRFIEDNQSFSFSGGISYNNYYVYSPFNNSSVQAPILINNFIGFPFEAEVRWFNNKKERYRILYGLIPVSRPTGFCRSFGFKLVGNISKQSYVGFGLVFGLGFHKQYL